MLCLWFTSSYIPYCTHRNQARKGKVMKSLGIHAMLFIASIERTAKTCTHTRTHAHTHTHTHTHTRAHTHTHTHAHRHTHTRTHTYTYRNLAKNGKATRSSSGRASSGRTSASGNEDTISESDATSVSSYGTEASGAQNQKWRVGVGDIVCVCLCVCVRACACVCALCTCVCVSLNALPKG